MRRWGIGAIVIVCAASGSRPHTHTRTLTHTVWDSVYTLDQAARGETAYAKVCSRCHKPTLAGGEESPPLVGGTFIANWNESTVFALHDRIRTSMPPDTTGAITPQGITDVIAHILKANGFPAGSAELPTDSTLKTITIKSARP